MAKKLMIDTMLSIVESTSEASKLTEPLINQADSFNAINVIATIMAAVLVNLKRRWCSALTVTVLPYCLLVWCAGFCMPLA
jgi:hypothetical protein